MTTYEELQAKWQHQRGRYRQWRLRLAAEANDLRDEFAAAIAAPEGMVPIDTSGAERRFVEITPPNAPVASMTSGSLDAAITDAGELPCAISILFEPSPNAYPKSVFTISVASRFNEGAVEWCEWDAAAAQPANGGWQRDKQAFISGLVAIFDRSFSFDPFDGIPSQRVGFVQTSG